MKTRILLTLLFAVLASAAQADCFAAYKAKRDDPLRLHYGIVQIAGTCPGDAEARGIVAARLEAAGWILLDLVGVQTAYPSDEQRANAGEHFLRY